VPKKTDTKKLPNDQEPGGQEIVERTVDLGLQTLQDPGDTPKILKKDAGEIEKPENTDEPEPKTQDEEPPADTLKIADEPPPPDENPPAENEEVPQPPADQDAATREQEVENALALKMRDAKDVKDQEVPEQLRTASVLYFYGKQDGKFLFGCAQSHGKSAKKTRFSASNIAAVLRKSLKIHYLHFHNTSPENFKVSGRQLPCLQEIIFESCAIEKFEFKKHFIGLFKNLKKFVFKKCVNLQYAKLAGGYILLVNLNGFQELFKNRTEFNYIKMDDSGVLVSKYATECFFNVGATCHGTDTPFFLSKANSISTISLAVPNVKTNYINLEHCETIDPHVVLNLDLPYKLIKFPTNLKITHLNFKKPMDGCSVMFEAHPSQIILEIDGFPQNSAEGTGDPFKMSFLTRKNSKLPIIKLNDTNLENIKWYEAKNRPGHTLLIPVIPNNQMKAIEQGLTAIESESAWNGGQTVELNSDFLFAAAAG
jgi:hypothetical protein